MRLTPVPLTLRPLVVPENSAVHDYLLYLPLQRILIRLGLPNKARIS